MFPPRPAPIRMVSQPTSATSGFLAALLVLGTLWPLVVSTASAAPRERVEADISTRTVAIGSDFSGVELIVFGTVVNPQTSAIRSSTPDAPAAPRYDVAIVLEGPRQSVNVRQKNRVAGIWVNTESRRFTAVPSYYGILTTRPLEELTRPAIRKWLGVGFDNLKLLYTSQTSAEDEATFREALVRLKQSQGLYRESLGGITFIGDALFRGTVALPANVSVGDFSVDVHLFRDGAYLDSFRTKIGLERTGTEALIHNFAFGQPFLYGVTAVLLAVLAGLTATAIFRKD
ncbi:MAG: TIGR02186 family protein [Pseudomonadota bacterium]